MSRKILIIGGTYFLGKAFKELMLEEGGTELTLLHRSKSADPNVKEITADRHDAQALQRIPHEHYDAIVDFCAYQKGDIESLLENINADTDQYIFISTSDVYKRGTGTVQDEEAELEDRDFGGEVGAYILGKVSLEREIAGACAAKGCKYTVLRPVFIFGEDNYAPREDIFFQWIDKAGQIIYPVGADGEFQLAYVKDVANAIKLVIANKDAYDKAFNVCEDKMYTYESFAELLRKATQKDFTIAEVSVDTVNEKGIPLPFPLTRAESNRYTGERIAALGLRFTDNVSAMAVTYEYSRR